MVQMSAVLSCLIMLSFIHRNNIFIYQSHTINSMDICIVSFPPANYTFAPTQSLLHISINRHQRVLNNFIFIFLFRCVLVLWNISNLFILIIRILYICLINFFHLFLFRISVEFSGCLRSSLLGYNLVSFLCCILGSLL